MQIKNENECGNSGDEGGERLIKRLKKGEMSYTLFTYIKNYLKNKKTKLTPLFLDIQKNKKNGNKNKSNCWDCGRY